MREWYEQLDSTRFGRFCLAWCAAFVAFGAWGSGGWLHDAAPVPLSWVAVPLLLIAQIAVLAALLFLISALLGLGGEISFDQDGSGD